MKTPEPIQRHPNGTFVLGTTPITTMLVWLLLVFHLAVPQYVAAAMGTAISGLLLVFRGALITASTAVWTLGITGCWRRIWRGNQSPPAP